MSSAPTLLTNSAEPMRPTVAGGWVRKGRDLDISAERAVVVCFSRRDVERVRGIKRERAWGAAAREGRTLTLLAGAKAAALPTRERRVNFIMVIVCWVLS